MTMKPEDTREHLQYSDSEQVLEDALQQIEAWSRAYPLKVFPEPDFEKAAKVLKDAGMTLDAISASNMRHVVTEVGNIARTALSKAHDGSPSIEERSTGTGSKVP